MMLSRRLSKLEHVAVANTVPPTGAFTAEEQACVNRLIEIMSRPDRDDARKLIDEYCKRAERGLSKRMLDETEMAAMRAFTAEVNALIIELADGKPVRPEDLIPEGFPNTADVRAPRRQHGGRARGRRGPKG